MELTAEDLTLQTTKWEEFCTKRRTGMYKNSMNSETIMKDWFLRKLWCSISGEVKYLLKFHIKQVGEGEISTVKR